MTAADRLTLFAWYACALSGYELSPFSVRDIDGATERALMAFAIGCLLRVGHLRVTGNEGPAWVCAEVARLCGDAPEDAPEGTELSDAFAARLEGRREGARVATRELLKGLENLIVHYSDDIRPAVIADFIATERAKLGGSAK